MPEEIKGSPQRKPPEPSSGHGAIDDWLGLLMPNLQPIVDGLDKSTQATVSNPHYAVQYKRAFYGLSEHGWIIELAPYDVSVNVLFLGSADFDRPPPLGTTGRTRYLKVTSLAETGRPELRDWVEQAGHTPGWK